MIYAVCAGRSDVADEAVAEAFARAIEHGDRVREPMAWMYRTALRIAVAELRRQNAHRPIRDTPAEEGPPDLRRLLGALRRLSPSQRAAIVLHYERDLPVREVSRLMGSSPAAVKVHLHRGRRKLREILGEEEIDHA